MQRQCKPRIASVVIGQRIVIPIVCKLRGHKESEYQEASDYWKIIARQASVRFSHPDKKANNKDKGVLEKRLIVKETEKLIKQNLHHCGFGDY